MNKLKLLIQTEAALQRNPYKKCSENLLHIFRTAFPKNTSGGLLLSKSRSIIY